MRVRRRLPDQKFGDVCLSVWITSKSPSEFPGCHQGWLGLSEPGATAVLRSLWIRARRMGST